MTTPTTPEPAAGSPDKPSPNAPRPVRQRPAGESGGHSVQDWEQPVQRPGQPARLEPLESKPAAPSADVDESERPGPSVSPSIDDADTPMPPVVPRYLRADGRAGGARPEARAQPFDARRQTLTAQSAALVDAITRGVAEALAVSLRPIIASTVDTLIPMILSLGSVPDPLPAQFPAAIPDAMSWDEAADGEAS